MSNQPKSYVCSKEKTGQKISPLTTMLTSGVMVVAFVACSQEKAEFSTTKVSAEAMEQFSSYEAVKDSPAFVEKLNKVLEIKSAGKLDNPPAILTVKGQNFKEWRQSLYSTWKINKLGYEGTWASYLKKHKLDIRGVTLQDFQLAEDTMFDTLKVGGNGAAQKALMQKYSAEDFAKAVRASLVRAAIAQLSKPQEGASLSLLAPSGDPFGAAASAVNNATNAAINKPLIDANVNAMNSCTKIREQCFKEDLDTTCKESANNPSKGGQPDHRTARQHDSGLVIEGISVTSPPIYRGSGDCQEYKWKASCDEGYKKYKNDSNHSEGEYYHKDSSTYLCQWVFDRGPSGKGDSAESFAKQAAAQDARIDRCLKLKDYSCTTNASIGGFYQGGSGASGGG